MNKKIIFGIIFILIFAITLTGCGNKDAVQQVHSKNTMLNAIDNLDCSKDNSDVIFAYIVSGVSTTNDALLNCKLKNKYTMIKEEDFADDNGDSVKKITLQLNDYDLKFSVTSAKYCTAALSATCTEMSYVITTDYQRNATEYFSKKYSEQNTNKSCNSSNYQNTTDTSFCSIGTKTEIASAVEYIIGYVEYINSLDVKILDDNYSIDINFPTKIHPHGGWYSVYLRLPIIDGKYVLEGSRDYQTFGNGIIINDLNEYLLNYTRINDIF